MPRPKPRPGHTTVQVTLSVPEDTREEFVQTAEREGTYRYGAQSALFRKMLRHWNDQAKWRERYEAERTRRIAAERIVQRIAEAIPR
jgi:hypothetical protein